MTTSLQGRVYLNADCKPLYFFTTPLCCNNVTLIPALNFSHLWIRLCLQGWRCLNHCMAHTPPILLGIIKILNSKMASSSLRSYQHRKGIPYSLSESNISTNITSTLRTLVLKSQPPHHFLIHHSSLACCSLDLIVLLHPLMHGFGYRSGSKYVQFYTLTPNSIDIELTSSRPLAMHSTMHGCILNLRSSVVPGLQVDCTEKKTLPTDTYCQQFVQKLTSS